MPLSNLKFITSDMALVQVPKNSFLICVHACNEANKVAIGMAVKASAGFAAMPCCIRDGLYSV